MHSLKVPIIVPDSIQLYLTNVNSSENDSEAAIWSELEQKLFESSTGPRVESSHQNACAVGGGH